jgi:hypothetical protein
MKVYASHMRLSEDPRLPVIDPRQVNVLLYDHPYETRFELSDGTLSEPMPLLSFDVPEAELLRYEIERDDDSDRRFVLPVAMVNQILAAARAN